jgi:hypothetical protein
MRRRSRSGRRGIRGQSLVEFALIVPLFMVLLLGMLEFGFVFTHHLGLEYATREGARMGASLAGGSTTGVLCQDVDKNVIAAFQRVATSSGSQLVVARISQIQIYDANPSGLPISGLVNVWVPGGDGTMVDGTALLWHPSSVGWNACTVGTRKNGSGYLNGTTPNTDSIGVSATYSYRLITAIGSMIGAFGSGQITITDRTTMALNPTAG